VQLASRRKALHCVTDPFRSASGKAKGPVRTGWILVEPSSIFHSDRAAGLAGPVMPEARSYQRSPLALEPADALRACLGGRRTRSLAGRSRSFWWSSGSCPRQRPASGHRGQVPQASRTPGHVLNPAWWRVLRNRRSARADPARDHGQPGRRRARVAVSDHCPRS
jgi:hypothetical protein